MLRLPPFGKADKMQMRKEREELIWLYFLQSDTPSYKKDSISCHGRRDKCALVLLGVNPWLPTSLPKANGLT